MKNIILKNMFLCCNKITISLSYLYAEIEILDNDWNASFKLTVTDSNMNNISLIFDTLEDVIYFVEKVVSKCKTKEEVVLKYQEINNNFEIQDNKIILSIDEVKQIILKYFSKDKKYKISINQEKYIDFYGN